MRTRREKDLLSSLSSQISKLKEVRQNKLEKQGLKKGSFAIDSLIRRVKNIRQTLSKQANKPHLTQALKTVAKDLSQIQENLDVSSESYRYFDEQSSELYSVLKRSLEQFDKEERQVEVEKQIQHKWQNEKREVKHEKKKELNLMSFQEISLEMPQADSLYNPPPFSSSELSPRSYDLRNKKQNSKEEMPTGTKIAAPKKKSRKINPRSSPEDPTRDKSR